MRSLLALWWWQWVTSVHDRLHAEVDALWKYEPPKGLESETNFTFAVPGEDSTVTYGSDDG